MDSSASSRHRKLREQFRRNTFIGFAAGIKIVAKRFNNVVSGNTKMSCAFFDHRHHGSENATHCAYFLSVHVFRRRHSKKVAEEFVSAINQVNIHEEAMLYEAAALVLVTGYSVRNAFMGEMDAARRAGITAAKNAETASANAAMPRAAGSQLETP
jgi:hypothetical protein